MISLTFPALSLDQNVNFPNPHISANFVLISCLHANELNRDDERGKHVNTVIVSMFEWY